MTQFDSGECQTILRSGIADNPVAKTNWGSQDKNVFVLATPVAGIQSNVKMKQKGEE